MGVFYGGDWVPMAEVRLARLPAREIMPPGTPPSPLILLHFRICSTARALARLQAEAVWNNDIEDVVATCKEASRCAQLGADEYDVVIVGAG
jgi:hypothetical protein